MWNKSLCVGSPSDIHIFFNYQFYVKFVNMGPKKNDTQDLSDELNILRDRLVAANMQNNELENKFREQLTETRSERENIIRDYHDVQRTNKEKDGLLLQMQNEISDLKRQIQNNQPSGQNDNIC